MRDLMRGPKLIHEVRKAAAWYVKGLYGANQVRQVVWKLTSPDQVIRTVLDHLDQLAQHQLAQSAA
jgi:tRNA-dihydrouridine synthase